MSLCVVFVCVSFWAKTDRFESGFLARASCSWLQTPRPRSDGIPVPTFDEKRRLAQRMAKRGW